MFKRPIWYTFAKGFAREFYKIHFTKLVEYTPISNRPKKEVYDLSGAEKLASEIGQKSKIQEWQKSLYGVNPLTGRSTLEPKVLKGTNQFATNYKQLYSAATKSNGGLRGSRATK